jgi:hypothetical protein
VAEQRYQAVLAVIADGLSVTVAAEKAGVSRQTLHAWLAKYDAGGLEVLADASHRPRRCPHQMPAAVEAAVLELRRVHGSGGRGGSGTNSSGGGWCRVGRCRRSQRFTAAWSGLG